MHMVKIKKIFVQIKRLTPYFIILLLSLAFTFPIFKSLHNTGISDWDLFCYIDEVPRKTILEYHQFPLWSPYSWGGHTIIAGLQDGFLRPTFLFTLLFGCVVGLKIEIFFMIALGMIGMFLLSKYYKMNATAGLLTASIFGLSSFFSLQITVGHEWVFPFTLLPFIFLFFLRSLQQKCYILPAAIFLVLVIFAGGNVHVVPPVSLFLASYSVILSIKDRDIKPLISLFFIFLLVFGLGAIKILPALGNAIEHPRLTSIDGDFTKFGGLYYVFLGSEQNINKHAFKGQKWGWHEYGAYTGLLPLILLLLALLYFWRKETPLILSGLLALFVSLGDFAKWAPWNLLHRLPFLSSTQVPSRFIIIAMFVIAILAGLAFELFYRKVKHSSKAKYFFIAILIFIILDLLIVNTKPFTQAFPNPLVEVSPGDVFHQIRDYKIGRSGAYTSMYLNLLANTGTLNGYGTKVDVKAPVKAAGDADYRGEVYLQDGGNATYKYWSPNNLIINAEAQNVTRLIINQNYDKGWKIKGGTPVENFNGLISARILPEDEVIEFYYLPSSFILGLMISFGTVMAILYHGKSFKRADKLRAQYGLNL